MAMKFNRNFDVGRVISRLITGVLSIYVGGTILTEFGNAMANTTSPLYTGLSLIGWTVETNTQTNGTAGYYVGCGAGSDPVTTAQPNCITDTTGSGVLSVVGILVIAQIIMEFIQF